MQKLPPRSLSPTLMTGLDGEPSADTPWTHPRRSEAHRSRRPGKEERCQLMLPAIPVSSHARTVPGPASLGSDSTATSVPMADWSNAEQRHRRFRWTTTKIRELSSNVNCVQINALVGKLSLIEISEETQILASGRPTQPISFRSRQAFSVGRSDSK